MPSNSLQALLDNEDDLKRLMEFHAKEAGTAPGRRYNVDVLNRAAVVLVCAAWEAYCEDIVIEAMDYMASDCSDISKLPEGLRKSVAEAIREDKHDMAAWKMAGDGWKSQLKEYAKRLTDYWNTPKAEPIQKLFTKSLGISDITSSWKWRQNPATKTRKVLDGFVKLRGEIAHRQKTSTSVTKQQAHKFYEHVCRIAAKTDQEVAKVLKATTGKRYW